MHTNKYRYTHIYIQIYTDIYRYIQIDTDIYKYMQIYADRYRYIQIHADRYRYIQIYTDTHLQVPKQYLSCVQIQQDADLQLSLNIGGQHTGSEVMRPLPEC